MDKKTYFKIYSPLILMVSLGVYVYARKIPDLGDMYASLVTWPTCFEKWGIQSFLGSPTNIQQMSEGCFGFNYGLISMPMYHVMTMISTNKFFWVILLILFNSIFLIRFMHKKLSTYWLASVILISPPSYLMIQRGNPDILAIAFCFIASLMLLKRYYLWFAVFASIISTYKFYGLILFVPILYLYIQNKKSKKLIVSIMIGFNSFLLVVYQWIIMKPKKFTDAASNHYGLPIWDNYFRKLDIKVDELIFQIIGAASIFIVAWYLVYKVSIFPLKNFMSENCSILSINFYSVYIFSYFAINNVDYRLLWLGIAIILDSQFYLQNSIQNKVLYSLILLSFFVVYPVGYHQIFGILPLQVIGDFTLHILTIIVTARLYLLLGNLKAFGK